MKLKVIREGGQWYVASTSYQPTAYGHIGKGTLWWAGHHKTRRAAREARKRILWGNAAMEVAMARKAGKLPFGNPCGPN
jgi:hypothetical protein